MDVTDAVPSELAVLRRALVRVTRAAQNRDRMALATVLPDLQPLVDAFMAWQGEGKPAGTPGTLPLAAGQVYRHKARGGLYRVARMGMTYDPECQGYELAANLQWSGSPLDNDNAVCVLGGGKWKLWDPGVDLQSAPACVLYEGVADGRYWLRPEAEFLDGRFVLMEG